MTEQNTRDIAVGANAKVDAHVHDCIEHRKSIETFMQEIRSDIKRINWYLPMIIGGIIVASHIFDVVFK